MSRRSFLIGSGAALICADAMAATTPSCTLTAEEEPGPYYVDDEIMRRDVTEGRPGVPLKLRVQLMDAKRCMPLSNAALDIWHCDATGVYSGYSYISPDGPPPQAARGPDGTPAPRRIDETRFLRGVQLSDKKGLAEFATLYPGWYYGRPIHIHVRVHMAGNTVGGKYAGGHISHTGQLYFPEEITADIAQLEPYKKRLSLHRTTQTEDAIFKEEHGAESILSLTRLKKGSNAEGFLATITIAVDPEATPPVFRRAQPTGGQAAARP